jgi:hypothetical protein
MGSPNQKPAADKAGRLLRSFAVVAETAREHSQNLVHIQARRLQVGFGLTLPTARIVASLAFAEARA